MRKQAILAHTALASGLATPHPRWRGRRRQRPEWLGGPERAPEQCHSEVVTRSVPPQRELAESKHQYSIDELKHRENLIQAQLDDELAQQETLEKHKVLCREEPCRPPQPTLAPGRWPRLMARCSEHLQGPGPGNLS